LTREGDRRICGVAKHTQNNGGLPRAVQVGAGGIYPDGIAGAAEVVHIAGVVIEREAAGHDRSVGGEVVEVVGGGVVHQHMHAADDLAAVRGVAVEAQVGLGLVDPAFGDQAEAGVFASLFFVKAVCY